MDLPAKKFDRALGVIDIKEPTEEIKKRLKDNIQKQDYIMDVIKKRAENFNYHSGIIKAGTGIGKSVLAIKICQYFQNNTLILVSNVKLLNEMVERFQDFTGQEIGQYGGGKKEIRSITICTKKSFALDHDLICPAKKFQTVIVDECHQGFSDAFRY